MPALDWLVIGGGIPALVAAFILQRRGARVLVVDDNRPSASRAGAGILSPLPPWRAPPSVAALAAAGAAAYPALLKDIGDDCNYRRCGMVVLPSGEGGGDGGGAGDGAGDGDKSQAVQINAAAVEESLPPQAALHLPQVAVLDPRRLLKTLRRQLPRLHATVTRLETRAGAVQRVHIGAGAPPPALDSLASLTSLTSLSSLSGAKILLSAGAWSGRLCPPPAPPIHPVRGQMLLYDNPGIALRGVVLHEESGCYILQREDGRLLAGSTVESVGFRSRTTRQGRAWLRRQVAAMLPQLARRRERRHWAGLRPAAAAPIIARHPRLRNLYINSGHFRYGVTMAPAAAAHLLRVTEEAAAHPYGFPQAGNSA